MSMREMLLDLKGVRSDTELAEVSGSGSPSSSSGSFMAAFFNQVTELKASIADLKKSFEIIEEKQSESVLAISVEQRDRICRELDTLTGTTNQAAQQIRNQLKLMDQTNTSLAKNNPSSPEVRIRSNMYGTLVREFADVMGEYQTMQTKYKNKLKETAARQIRIVNPEATAEQIEAALADPSKRVFAEKIIPQDYQRAAKGLSDVSMWHADIVKLERSITEVHQMFTDLAVLIDNQGDVLDHIEVNVGIAEADTGKAVNQLQVAKDNKIAARKRAICISFIVLVVVALLLLPIFLKIFDVVS